MAIIHPHLISYVDRDLYWAGFDNKAGIERKGP